jgi:hypothetical protein
MNYYEMMASILRNKKTMLTPEIFGSILKVVSM